MKLINSFLVRSRLCDADGTLSLTSIMMMVLIAKIAFTNTLDWTIISAMFLSLASYNGKKILADRRNKKQLDDTDRLEKLETSIKSVATAAGLNKILK